MPCPRLPFWRNLSFCFSSVHKHKYTLSVSSLFLTRSETTLMDRRKEKNGPWLSVPQFGDWDQKGQVPDYSLDFSKIRETRKQNKTNISRASLGNEEEFVDSTSSSANTGHSSDHPQPHYHHQNDSPTARKSFLSYFNCCVKA